jgi:fumarate hydratase class I
MNLAAVFGKNFDSGDAMRLLTRDGVSREMLAGRSTLRVEPRLLRQLAREAFRDVNFLFRTDTLEQWAAILDDPAASVNDPSGF